jgi:hypothetical protein
MEGDQVQLGLLKTPIPAMFVAFCDRSYSNRSQTGSGRDRSSSSGSSSSQNQHTQAPWAGEVSKAQRGQISRFVGKVGNAIGALHDPAYRRAMVWTHATIVAQMAAQVPARSVGGGESPAHTVLAHFLKECIRRH